MTWYFRQWFKFIVQTSSGCILSVESLFSKDKVEIKRCIPGEFVDSLIHICSRLVGDVDQSEKQQTVNRHMGNHNKDNKKILVPKWFMMSTWFYSFLDFSYREITPCTYHILKIFCVWTSSLWIPVAAVQAGHLWPPLHPSLTSISPVKEN